MKIGKTDIIKNLGKMDILKIGKKLMKIKIEKLDKNETGQNLKMK